MRWDNQRLRPDAANDAGSQPALFELAAVTRTFDTPGFRGMTFHEVHAKTIISKVPEASRVPFRWTINPYRGCSHACAYCITGDTPVLMADGRTKPIAQLRVGDAIYGTVRQGSVPAVRADHRASPLADGQARLPGHARGRHHA